MAERGSVAVVLAKQVLMAAALRGADPAALLVAVGISLEQLNDPLGRVPLEQFQAIWREGARLTADPDFGLHAAEMSRQRTGNALFYAASTCATFEEVLRCFDRYLKLAHDVLVISRRQEAEHCHLRVEISHPSGPERQGVEFALARLSLFARECLGDRFVLHAVDFPHAAPERIAEHLRIFRIAPRFLQPHAEMSFDAALLRQPLAAFDPVLHAHLREYLDQTLSQVESSDRLISQVERVVAEGLSKGPPDIDVAARRLQMSVRTLQRRLQQDGTSFLNVVSQARQKLAERYLGEASLSLTEIAFLLGFTEPSNFHRAFKRWTGKTPQQARRTALGGHVD